MVGAPLVYTGSWHAESNDGEYAAFATHTEALAYADRMARTVEVTLPRITDDCGAIPNSPKVRQSSIWYGRQKDGTCWLSSPLGRSTPPIVGREELAPLALALLALHYRNETL